jgi:glycosyltransferase involved in cell wall biosynthesis
MVFMKVLITQSNLTLRGGAERTILKIAKHYGAKIYTAEYDKEKTYPGYADLDVEVIKKGALAGALPYGRAMQGIHYGLSFYNLKIKDDYDVINAHIAPSHWIRNRNPRVLWYCHTPLREVWDLYKYRMQFKSAQQKLIHGLGAAIVRTIDRRVVKDIEFIFANSEYTRERVVRYFGRADAVALDSALEHELYKNKGDDKFFFYAARYSSNKQQDFAIDAFRIFKNKAGKAGKKYRLILAGAMTRDMAFQPYFEKLKQMAKSVGGVELLLNISDNKLRELFGTCTAGLYPPLHEDYGLGPLETMASGKPIIALDEGGPKWTVLNGKTGYLVTTPKEMAARMLYVVEHPAIAKKMGGAGIRRVRERYSYERFFKIYDKKVREVARS